ncbi:MAG: hypothetical protein WC716_08545 [Chitinophagaceae bacterium]|jgi:hypothetical protein
MEKIAHAIIEHNLKPSEILNIPAILSKHSSASFAGEWEWTSHDMDASFLEELWNKKEIDFINNSASIEDLALLQKDKITIDFMTPHLITFDTLLPWDIYNTDESLREEFNHLVRMVCELIKATDVAIIPDLSSLPFYDENTDLSVNALRSKSKHNEGVFKELP